MVSALTPPARMSQSVFFCHAPAWSKPHAPASGNTTKTLRIFGQTCALTARLSVRKLLRYRAARLDHFHWRKAFFKRCETVRKLRGNVRSIMGVIWGFFSVLRVRVLLGLSSPRRNKARSVAGLGFIHQRWLCRVRPLAGLGLCLNGYQLNDGHPQTNRTA